MFDANNITKGCKRLNLFDWCYMKQSTKIILIATSIFAIIFIVAGGFFIGAKMSQEKFLNDFNEMNGHYKQALFETGQGNREVAVREYDLFVTSTEAFALKYASSRPAKLQDDVLFNTDFEKVLSDAKSSKENVYTGNLSVAHKQLEQIRPVFNELLRRNDLSLLSVVLVDFHDSMENVLDAANSKDASLVLTTYDEASVKLIAVESELNDADIQNIRVQLDLIKALAVANNLSELPSQAGKLKSSYVNVYLSKG